MMGLVPPRKTTTTFWGPPRPLVHVLSMQVCHVIIHIQEGSRFDTQLLKMFRVLQAAKHALAPFVRSQTTSGLPSRPASSSSSRSTTSTPASKSLSPVLTRNASVVSLMPGHTTLPDCISNMPSYTIREEPHQN
ncbi:uncharacterized protein LOC112094595 isoform X2 [Morus notabilis]|uniref:uncharacterized protein LOC112094595 isoform X2 n=1 Tax=Morus notabilis TaxID=981085 RepID=UPI000CED732C|nr:uncharacterized protein LOC112094595 isoform X2 [Morus notabilis]